MNFYNYSECEYNSQISNNQQYNKLYDAQWVNNLYRRFSKNRFLFNDIILNWSESDVMLESILEKLPPIFNSVQNYYAAFIPHIIEETKAILRQGFEKKSIKAKFTISLIKRPKNIKNPVRLGLSGRIPKDLEGTQHVLYLSINGQECLALGYIDKKNKQQSLEVQFMENDVHFGMEDKISVNFLGSVITQQRMFNACMYMNNTIFMNSIYTNQLPSWDNKGLNFNNPFYNFSQMRLNYNSGTINDDILVESDENKEACFQSLNKIQNSIVNNFVSLQPGIYCVQGPPGTGKTTTINALLKKLVNNRKRVLVSAASNKAVQVIAKRFIKLFPEVTVALAGVENKLSDELRDIFIHDWLNYQARKLDKMFKAVRSRILFSELPRTQKKFKSLEESVSKSLTKITSISEYISKHMINLTDLLELNINKYKTELQIYLKKYRLTVLESQKIKNIFISKQSSLSKEEKEIKLNLKMRFAHIVKESLNTARQLIAYIIKESRPELEISMLNNAEVIFMTLSTAGRQMLRKGMNDIDVLIVDEAGQAVESETLIPLHLNPTKMLLVGDTKQLPATVISENAKQNGYERSMMWRLLHDREEDYTEPYKMLTIQYRMHTEIRQWPSQRYYNNKLIDGKNIKTGKPLSNLLSKKMLPYIIVNTNSKENKYKNSFENKQEAQLIINLLKYLKFTHKINLAKSVGIITFYAGQKSLIQRMVSNSKIGKVKNINTVDGFQGGENDIIIISFVRANNEKITGFVKDFRRLNVAITRAKHHLICICNVNTFQANIEISAMINDAKQRKVLFEENVFRNIMENSKKSNIEKCNNNGKNINLNNNIKKKIVVVRKKANIALAKIDASDSFNKLIRKKEFNNAKNQNTKKFTKKLVVIRKNKKITNCNNNDKILQEEVLTKKPDMLINHKNKLSTRKITINKTKKKKKIIVVRRKNK